MKTKIVVLLAGATLASACAKKPQVAASEAPPTAPAAGARVVSAEAASSAVPEPVARMMENFRRVHFAFDSSDLSEASRDALSANVEIMLKHPALRVEVQGHCDDRGTTDYNLSLGQRRADAIRKYMSTSGVPGARLSAVSYGKEKPLVKGTGEHAWSQNRRAEFRVTWGGEAVAEAPAPESEQVQGTVD